MDSLRYNSYIPNVDIIIDFWKLSHWYFMKFGCKFQYGKNGASTIIKITQTK